ncbi:MAG: Holliday junction branch migration protein RuvA [Clostridia bacterium]|nr:Holliday junction branch migration protein RuvA [Clostridia bacterium]
MLYSLRGTLTALEPSLAVVECGGVGFACHVTMNTARRLPSIGQEVFLYTILNVREDAMDLFGFADQSELNCFKQLTSVSGVGPKAANAILSELSPDRLASAVAMGDFKAITRANGVGPKLAQRVVLELKDKLGIPAVTVGKTTAPTAAPVGGNAEEAVRALTTLGFTAGEAAEAVGRLDAALPVEKLIHDALKALARR